VGGFWKHSMIAIPVTAVLWLLARRGLEAWRSVAISLAFAAGGLVACTALFGPDFIKNIFVGRHYSFGHVLGNIGHLQWSAPAMALWLVWVSGARTTAAKFTAIHVPIGLAACILQWFGDKIFGNAEFDLIIALGIALGVAFEQIECSPASRFLSAGMSRIVVVLILVVRLLATDRQEPLLVMFDPEFRHQFERAEQSVLNEAKEVAPIDSGVFCTLKVVCRSAGKPFVVDDFKTEQMVETGAIIAAGLDELLQVRDIVKFRNDPAGMGMVDTSLRRALARRW
jgi:hypothetical protein